MVSRSNSFHAELAQDAADQITWEIGNSGFDMVLSGQAPSTIARALRKGSQRILAGMTSKAFQMWAVHPGGRSVLDAVEDAFELDEAALPPLAAFFRSTETCRLQRSCLSSRRLCERSRRRARKAAQWPSVQDLPPSACCSAPPPDESLAMTGSCALVIGGGPAAAC